MKAYSLAVSMEAADKNAAAIVDASGSTTNEVKETVDCQMMMNTRRGGGGGSGRALLRRSQARRAAAPAPASVLVKRGQQRRECRACGGPHEAAVNKFRPSAAYGSASNAALHH